MIGNKIADKITSIVKTKEKENTNKSEEIYIPPEKRQQIIDDPKLFRIIIIIIIIIIVLRIVFKIVFKNSKSIISKCTFQSPKNFILILI